MEFSGSPNYALYIAESNIPNNSTDLAAVRNFCRLGINMGLQEEIDKRSSQIKTDSYPMSIGELLNLYRENELDVHPEFQRVYRWTDSQKTRLIESILLGIPVPPVFVAQRTDGVWDVVDGVQRLSTIFQFVGVLRDELRKKVKPLVLEGTKFLPSLDGKSWEGENAFSKALQLYLKRAKIDVNIVLKESDEKSKYELFMRLNTGGTALEPQEVRNCLMIMAFPETYKWIRDLSEDANFREAISISDQLVVEQYPMELVTRFLAFRTLPQEDLNQIGDIGDFLNDSIEALDGVRKTKKAIEEKCFRETFRLIKDELEDNGFRRFDDAKKRFLGGFSISAFEVVALGVGFNAKSDGSAAGITKLRQKVEELWKNTEFTKNSGSGVRASTRIPKIVPLGRRLFKK